MRDHLTLHNFDVEKDLVFLSSTKSHFYSKVLWVFNLNTEEFRYLEQEFNLVDFRTSLNLDSASAGKRGNKQTNTGFTTASLNTRCEATGISLPAMFTGTPDHKPGFEALSTLAAKAASFHNDKLSVFSGNPTTRTSQASFRHARFAGMISPHNTLEYMAPTMNDKDNPFVVAHVDSKNDPSPHYSVTITASRLLVVVPPSPGLAPELKRVLQIGTSRKSCSDFMERAKICSPLIESLTMFYKSIPVEHRSFDPTLFFQKTIGQTCVFDGVGLLSPANGDRCIQESATCFCVSYFVEHGNPQSIHEVYEVVLGSVWVTEPRKYLWMVKE